MRARVPNTTTTHKITTGTNLLVILTLHDRVRDEKLDECVVLLNLGLGEKTIAAVNKLTDTVNYVSPVSSKTVTFFWACVIRKLRFIIK